MSVRVGPGEGLVAPVDGVDVAVNAVVNAVVVGGVRTRRIDMLKTVLIRV